MRNGLILTLPLLAACTTVEGTGRSQLNLYSPEEEVQLGLMAYDEELKDAKILPATDPRAQRVRAIGRRIEAASRDRQPNMAARMQWTWTVVDDPKVINAWMVPGGRGAVYTGMIDFVRSDDELAVILGHEASHAIARHGTERMTRGRLVGFGVATTGAVTGSGAAETLAAVAAEGMISLPHSRHQEIEADEMGLMTAAQAGYDPRTAIDLWRRMQDRGGERLEFLSTHPSEGTRIGRLQAIMPEAYQLYLRSVRTPASGPATTAGEPHSR